MSDKEKQSLVDLPLSGGSLPLGEVFLKEVFTAKPESDPTGKTAHDPGAKLDAGKRLPWVVKYGFRHALAEVVTIGTAGAYKYTKYGWKDVPDAKARYLEAFERHMEKYFVKDEVIDPETKGHHVAAAVWNLLAWLEFDLTGGGE